MLNGLPKRQLGKSKFSMYLRTKCDRELYLSLFSNNPAALAAAGIPVPLKSRPGVELITNSGREFEYEQYAALINAIPGNVLHNLNGRGPVDLAVALKAVAPRRSFYSHRSSPKTSEILPSRPTVQDQKKAHIPELAGLRPDVLFVATPGSAQFEVLPNGARKMVGAGDPRRPVPPAPVYRFGLLSRVSGGNIASLKKWGHQKVSPTALWRTLPPSREAFANTSTACCQRGSGRRTLIILKTLIVQDCANVDGNGGVSGINGIPKSVTCVFSIGRIGSTPSASTNSLGLTCRASPHALLAVRR